MSFFDRDATLAMGALAPAFIVGTHYEEIQAVALARLLDAAPEGRDSARCAPRGRVRAFALRRRGAPRRTLRLQQGGARVRRVTVRADVLNHRSGRTSLTPPPSRSRGVLSMTRALVLLLFGLGSACVPAHVQLADAPGPDAPLEERRAFYEEHRPVLVQVRPPVLDNSIPPASIELSNGARIHHPEDLLLHVDDTSPTAEAVRRLETAEQWLLLWRTAGITVALAGLGGALASWLAFPETPWLPMVLSSSASAVIAAPMIILSRHYWAHAGMERETAFLTYDRSLRERLALPSTTPDGADRVMPEGSAPRDAPPPLRELDSKSAASESPGASSDSIEVLCAALPALVPAIPAPSTP